MAAARAKMIARRFGGKDVSKTGQGLHAPQEEDGPQDGPVRR